MKMAANVEYYVQAAKRRLGNARMTDRELGERFGLSTGSISNARYGKASDPVCLKLAAVLGIDAGEILMVARAEREPDDAVRAALKAYVGKVLGTVAGIVAAVPLTLALLMPRDAHADDWRKGRDLNPA
jgi:transcriptional regulator with XRE-family HTH domain